MVSATSTDDGDFRDSLGRHRPPPLLVWVAIRVVVVCFVLWQVYRGLAMFKVIDEFNKQHLVWISACLLAVCYGGYQVYRVLMKTRVKDVYGKQLPGPKWGDYYLKKLRHARRNRRVAEFINGTMINTWGNGRLCGISALGRDIVFLAHPDDVKTVLGGPHQLFPKAKRYDRLKFVLNEGLVTSSGHIWQLHRRMMNNGFDSAKFTNFVHIFVAKTELLSQEIMRSIDQGASGNDVEVDMTRQLGVLSYRVICKAGFGYEPGPHSKGFSPDAVSAVLDEINLRLQHNFDWWHKLFPVHEAKVSRMIRGMDSAIYDIIAKRREEQKKESREERRGVQERAPPRDLLDVLLRASTEEEEGEKEDGSGSGSGSGSSGKDETKTPATTLSAGELRDHMFTFLAAGTETTATTTAWLLLELCKNPQLQEKVLADIDHACAHKSSADEPFEYEDVEKLVYLQAALKEILRLHPPATVIGRNNVEPVSIGGGQYTVPKMTNLIVSIYSLHHNPEFWDKPEEFIPERFLPENAKATMKHPWQYVPFSAGPRNCIGQRFARYEVLSIVATILRRFRVSMTPSALAEYIIEETLVRRPVSLRITFHLRGQSG